MEEMIFMLPPHGKRPVVGSPKYGTRISIRQVMKVFPLFMPITVHLYFTSNELPGYGGTDLFVVRKTATGEWGIPENLGYPINTIENEGSLVVAADGKTAYYASDRADSRGLLDLYSFELREDVRPAKTIWVKGKVYDKKTGKGLPSSVELGDLRNKRIISKLQTDETGNYLTTLPIGNDYAFNVNRKGYLFFSENFMLVQSSADSVYQMDIPLQPIEVNASIILKNIFFDVNQYELKPASQIELDDVVKLLKENPLVFIQINGYTDNVGKPADNLLLSENRAKSVVNYLKAKGIDPKRLSFKGYGETQPVSPNTTEAGRAHNRRTELKVCKSRIKRCTLNKALWSTGMVEHVVIHNPHLQIHLQMNSLNNGTHSRDFIQYFSLHI